MAPPSSTAKRSSDMEPSSTRRLWMKATPENTVASVIGSRGADAARDADSRRERAGQDEQRARR